MSEQETKKRPVGWKIPTLLILLLGGAFLGGYIPTYLKNRDLNQSLDQLREQREAVSQRLRENQTQLRIAILGNELATMIFEVEQQNFDAARKRSTRFFDQLREVTFSLEDPARRTALQSVLDHRDEITSDLSLLDSEAASKLRALYAQLPSASADAPSQ